MDWKLLFKRILLFLVLPVILLLLLLNWGKVSNRLKSSSDLSRQLAESQSSIARYSVALTAARERATQLQGELTSARETINSLQGALDNCRERRAMRRSGAHAATTRRRAAAPVLDAASPTCESGRYDCRGGSTELRADGAIVFVNECTCIRTDY